MCKVHPICWLLLICQNQSSLAGVSFDRSVVVPKAVQGQNLSGQMLIKPEFGKQVGGNLFHSFAHFNIGKNESATFTGNGSINNVIGRVTGGLSSHIDGLLCSTIPNANLYLLNPNGILFGKNAKLDLPGSFHASTAAYLDLKHGGRFDALDFNNDLLVSAPPQAFGFLDNAKENSGTITVSGSQLSLAPDKTLDLNAGNISIKNNAKLQTEAGEIRLVATQDRQALSLVADKTGALPLPTRSGFSGNAALGINNSTVDSQGNGGGRIALSAGQLDIKGSEINVSNDGDLAATAAKGIAIRGGNVRIASNVVSRSFQTGSAGDISVRAKELKVINDGYLASAARASGNAGNVSVNAEQLTVANGGLIASQTSAQGDAGKVEVSAKAIKIDRKDSVNATGIVSNALDKNGNAGTVMVNTDDLKIVNGGLIASLTYYHGNANTVKVKAKSITIDGKNGSNPTGILADGKFGSFGQGGEVSVNTDALVILSGGSVSSTAHGRGDAGGVDINAKNIAIAAKGSLNDTGIFSDTFSQGDAGAIVVTADTLSVDGQGSETKVGIFSEAGASEPSDNGDIVGSTGRGGTISIKSGTLELLGGGKISSSTRSTGSGGDVAVIADRIKILGRYDAFENPSSGIYAATTLGNVSGGDAGNIKIRAGTIDILKTGAISSSTETPGKAGKIFVTADNLNIDGQDTVFRAAGIFSTSFNSTGDGNDISIQTKKLTLFNGGQISSKTGGFDGFNQGRVGSAGDIKVEANTIKIDGEGHSPMLTGITASYLVENNILEFDPDIVSGGHSVFGNAGNVHIKAIDSFFLMNNGRVESVSEKNIPASKPNIPKILINGGKLNIEVGNLFYALNNGALLVSADKGLGTGGDIFIRPINSLGPSFTVLDDSQIVAKALEGDGGHITIATRYYLESTDSTLSASSKSGKQGIVDVSSVHSNIAGSISVLPNNFLDKSGLLKEGCGLRLDASSSLSVYSVQGLVQDSPDTAINYLPKVLTACFPPQISAK
jgi:filamentous hemagglutinin family protein